MKYFAIPHLDFFYIVEVSTGRSQHEQEIEITKDQYVTLLEANQKFGYIIRARLNGDSIELFSCEEQKPSQYHKWSVEIGEWVVDEELKLKQQREEIEQRIQFLRNEIIYLTALDEDVSEEIAESKKLRDKLKSL